MSTDDIAKDTSNLGFGHDHKLGGPCSSVQANTPRLEATVKANGVVYRDITAEFVTASGSMISESQP